MKEFIEELKKHEKSLSQAIDMNEMFKMRGFIAEQIHHVLEEETSGGLDESITTGEYLRLKQSLQHTYTALTGDVTDVFKVEKMSTWEKPF